MKTRSASATPKKKAPPAKKSAVKLPQPTPTSAEAPPTQSPAPPSVSSDDKPSRPTVPEQVKSAEIISPAAAAPNITSPPPSLPEQAPAPAAEETKATDASDAQVASETKPAKKTRRIIKRVIRKTVVRSARNPVSGEPGKTKLEEFTKENDVVEAADQKPLVKDVETAKKDELSVINVEKPAMNAEVKVEDSAKKEEVEGKPEFFVGGVIKSPKEQELTSTESKVLEDQEPNNTGKEKDEQTEQQEGKQMKSIKDKVEDASCVGKIEEDSKEELTDFDCLLQEADDEKIEEIADQDIHDELEQEFPEDDVPEHGQEVGEHERSELNAAAKERKLRKEMEIFVGGLDRDVMEEDLRRVFQNAGEVVDVRLHKDPSTNKNKGYAFVRFATKEQVKRALSEMKNPVIRGKRCGTAPSEDNDTLFVGNICNTWTKEAIKQKLKEYGIEGVEKITLVADPRREGTSRGFAFLEFSCHGEAMVAYKRLQKPDAIFGHPEKTVKVAFAEPLREPDPKVMAQVKSVFVDGLPPHWDEDNVKEKFKRFGEIVRVVLARNMTTARRKDFGFVDFTTHEAAVACIEIINSSELVDGNSKIKVKARLSNPLPKTQAVRGGMAGGFRIARGNGATFLRSGKGLGRGGPAVDRPNFKQDRGFYPHGPGQGGRTGFANDHELNRAYPPRRHDYEDGGRWGHRGAHQGSARGPFPNRANFDRTWHGGHGDYDPLRRHPFPPEEMFSRPYLGKPFDDRHFYDDRARGMKRPYPMTDLDPGYMEPSSHRPRFGYSDAPDAFRGNRHRDDFGAHGGLYQQDYYGSDYDRGAHPSYYGSDRAYGRGYYY